LAGRLTSLKSAAFDLGSDLSSSNAELESLRRECDGYDRERSLAAQEAGQKLRELQASHATAMAEAREFAMVELSAVRGQAEAVESLRILPQGPPSSCETGGPSYDPPGPPPPDDSPDSDDEDEEEEEDEEEDDDEDCGGSGFNPNANKKLHGKKVLYDPSARDMRQLTKYKQLTLAWMKKNPGVLCKIGGKQVDSMRHKSAAQYDREYFDRNNSTVFEGIFTDSSLAAWIELQLIQFAYYELKIGVNHNRGQTGGNMAGLPGSPYSRENPGCIYIVPVLAKIKSQDEFKNVHESYHIQKRNRDAGHTLKNKLRILVQADCKKIQERFIRLGGEGDVTPAKVIALFGTEGKFRSKNKSAGVNQLNTTIYQRWEALFDSPSGNEFVSHESDGVLYPEGSRSENEEDENSDSDDDQDDDDTSLYSIEIKGDRDENDTIFFESENEEDYDDSYAYIVFDYE